MAESLCHDLFRVGVEAVMPAPLLQKTLSVSCKQSRVHEAL
jgi:hypothetical protein